MFQSGYGSRASVLSDDDTLEAESVKRAQEADRAAFIQYPCPVMLRVRCVSRRIPLRGEPPA